MTATYKSYIQTPNFTFAPDKLIRIGQIIHDPKYPNQLVSEPLQPLPEIHPHVQEDWEEERVRTLSGSVGIFATFLAMILGLGGDIAGNFKREDKNILKFDRLETFYINLTDDSNYVKKSMEVEAVKTFFEKNPRKTPFMITGVKIARGAKITTTKVRGFGGEGKVEIDGSSVGAPVSGGPTLDIAKHNAQTQSFGASSDFVFAYSLRKIYLQRRSGVLTSSDFVKGATEGVEGDKDAFTKPKQKANDVMEYDVLGIDSRDYGTDDSPFGTFKSIVRNGDGDGDEKCVLLTFEDD